MTTAETITAADLTAGHNGRTLRIGGVEYGLIASQKTRHEVLLAVQGPDGQHRPKRVDPGTSVEVLA